MKNVVVGIFMYEMVRMRHDISHAIKVVGKYRRNLGKRHWQAVKQILRCILKTLDLGLDFERDDSIDHCMVGFVDFDYADDLDKRQSTTGCVFTLAKAPISWKSTLQTTFALSTTEAKYMAVGEVVQEAILLQGLLGKFGDEQKQIYHCIVQ